MAMEKHDKTKDDVAPRRRDFFDRFFDDWPELFRRPVLLWPERGFDPMRVEEFTEDGTLVVRVEVAGVDPDNDIEVRVEGDALHIVVERREEEKKEGRNYIRREQRYGSFQRDIPLPKGTSDADIKANYNDGILEVRLPMTKAEVEAGKRIPITKG